MTSICKYVVIAPCFNEQLILPHFLHHYRDAYKILIFDDGSTDRTLEILRDNAKVEIRSLTGGEADKFDDRKLLKIKNEAWREYSGCGIDYVIIVDMDEFVCSTDGSTIGQFLFSLKQQCPKTAFFRATGFNMVDKNDLNLLARDEKEAATIALAQNVNVGFFDNLYCKTVIFNPNAIQNINYCFGAHYCFPKLYRGYVAYSQSDPPLLLCHFKYIFGEDQFVARRKLFGSRMSQFNRKRNMGAQYFKPTDDDNRNEYRSVKTRADLIVIDNPALRKHRVV